MSKVADRTYKLRKEDTFLWIFVIELLSIVLGFILRPVKTELAKDIEISFSIVTHFTTSKCKDVLPRHIYDAKYISEEAE